MTTSRMPPSDCHRFSTAAAASAAVAPAHGASKTTTAGKRADAPRVVDKRRSTGVDDSYEDDFEHSTSQSCATPAPSASATHASRLSTDEASRRIGQRLLQGWTLLEANCADCIVRCVQTDLVLPDSLICPFSWFIIIFLSLSYDYCICSYPLVSHTGVQVPLMKLRDGPRLCVGCNTQYANDDGTFALPASIP